MREGLGGRAKGREVSDSVGWKVAGYARLSREDGDGGESNSITVQRELIDDWAAHRGDVEVVAHYADDGYSGATFDRPAFTQMMADAERGAFNTIAVKDLSRFGRSYLDCGSWIERDLPRLGVRLFSIVDGFDSMGQWTYDMALLLPVKNLINEMQVVATSQKVRASLEAKRERGEMVGNFAPYGYVKDPIDKHKLAVDEPAAGVVRRVFSAYESGASASSIARELNAEGVASPAAYRRFSGSNYCTSFGTEENPGWHAQTVLRILRNEIYTGTLVQGRTRRPNWRLREGLPVPEAEWTRAPGAHEPIVSQETFNTVRKRLDGN